MVQCKTLKHFLVVKQDVRHKALVVVLTHRKHIFDSHDAHVCRHSIAALKEYEVTYSRLAHIRISSLDPLVDVALSYLELN